MNNEIEAKIQQVKDELYTKSYKVFSCVCHDLQHVFSIDYFFDIMDNGKQFSDEFYINLNPDYKLRKIKQLLH